MTSELELSDNSKKVSQKDKRNIEQLGGKYMNIHFNSYHVVMDPIFNCLALPFTFAIKSFGCKYTKGKKYN